MTRGLLIQKIDRFFGIEIETCWGEDTPDFDYSKEYISHRNKLCSALHAVRSRGYHVSDWWEPTTDSRIWHIKHDNTCGVSKHLNGWEIASFKAKPKDMREIAAAVHEWEKLGVRVNNNCGLHVHVDVSDFSEKQMGILMARWAKVENEFLKLVPRYRRYEAYCLPIAETKRFSRTKKYTPEQFWNQIKPKNLSVRGNLQRRVTLNTVNYLRSKHSYTDRDRCTVEFRFPESTLDWITILNWVSVFLAFVETSKTKRMPVNLQSIDSDSKFFSYIGVEDEELKKWMRIRKFLFSGNKDAELVL